MRIVDICNHYIFNGLRRDFGDCNAKAEVIDVRQKAEKSINEAWPDIVKEHLEKHLDALYYEALVAIDARDSLEGILEHKIFNGAVKERFMAYSDEYTIDKAFEALKEELKAEQDELEKRILERHLFELRENAKKDLESLRSSYVFSDEFEGMFDSVNTKDELDTAYANAYDKVRGHAFKDWVVETGWIEMRTQIASLQLDVDRFSDRDNDASDLWNSDLVREFDIREPFGGSSVEASDRVLARFNEFVSGCRLKKGKAVEIAEEIKALQLSLINAQAMADEYADISSHVIGLQKLTRLLKSEGSEVVLRTIGMDPYGHVSSVEFEKLINEVL